MQMSHRKGQEKYGEHIGEVKEKQWTQHEAKNILSAKYFNQETYNLLKTTFLDILLWLLYKKHTTTYYLDEQKWLDCCDVSQGFFWVKVAILRFSGTIC